MKFSNQQSEVLKYMSKGYRLLGFGKTTYVQKGDDTKMIKWAVVQGLVTLGILKGQLGTPNEFFITEKGNNARS